MNNSIQPSNERASIARKAGRGVIWNFLSFGVSKGILLLTTSVLARLLTKEDFGLVAVAVVAINYLSVVKDLGLGLALIQRREDVDEAANTVFTINLLLGAALSLAVVPLAPLFAAYFQETQVTPVLRWLGLSFALNALGATHINLLMRDLDYRRKFIPDMTNTVVKGILSLWLAFSGLGVWALVFGQLAGAAASALAAWMVKPWRPRLRVNLPLARQLAQFGASVTGVDILTVFVDNLSYLIIGRLLGVAALGVFSISYRLPEMLIVGNLWLIASVLFPAFSSIQDKPDELRRGFLVSIRLVQLIVMPLCLGLFVAAEPIVRVFFGEQWLETIPLLRILSLYALIYSIGYHAGDVYKAIGRPDILFKLNIMSAAILVPALVVGSQFGLIGFAWGYLTAIIFDQAITLYVAGRFIRVSFWDILSEMKPAALGVLLMMPAAWGMLVLTQQFSPFAQLPLVVLSGAAGYLVVVWRLEGDELFRLARLVLSGKRA
ncbi:MAG: lipopolysaccharide biosynthesis protein [Anaerolineales bacterium]|nr:lipopolysaccharide biosynthesis protein [Anaerolineales bacterium]MCX7754167.1 lipopolysaccharide biosynthesis protein [Anaerolineales bacterium]MDW8278081.1 lipopolysaccharide biosynthesis protein [Anaerolineales bacterium]